MQRKNCKQRLIHSPPTVNSVQNQQNFSFVYFSYVLRNLISFENKNLLGLLFLWDGLSENRLEPRWGFLHDQMIKNSLVQWAAWMLRVFCLNFFKRAKVSMIAVILTKYALLSYDYHFWFVMYVSKTPEYIILWNFRFTRIKTIVISSLFRKTKSHYKTLWLVQHRSLSF